MPGSRLVNHSILTGPSSHVWVRDSFPRPVMRHRASFSMSRRQAHPQGEASPPVPGSWKFIVPGLGRFTVSPPVGVGGQITPGQWGVCQPVGPSYFNTCMVQHMVQHRVCMGPYGNIGNGHPHSPKLQDHTPRCVYRQQFGTGCHHGPNTPICMALVATWHMETTYGLRCQHIPRHLYNTQWVKRATDISADSGYSMAMDPGMVSESNSDPVDTWSLVAVQATRIKMGPEIPHLDSPPWH